MAGKIPGIICVVAGGACYGTSTVMSGTGSVIFYNIGILFLFMGVILVVFAIGTSKKEL